MSTLIVHNNALIDTLNQESLVIFVDPIAQVPITYRCNANSHKWDGDTLVLNTGDRILNGYVQTTSSDKRRIDTRSQQFVRWYAFSYKFPIVDACHIEPPRYIIKRVRPKQDWSMQTTEDWERRFITNWRYGLLDRLPDEIEHVIIACFEDGDGFGLLMHNLTHAMLPVGNLSEQDHETVLDGMAALHAAFWQDQVFSYARLNLCPPEQLFTFTSPHKVRWIGEKFPSFILEMILEGRHLLPGFVEKDLIDQVDLMLFNPTPFCSALAGYPQTLVHGDFWWSNLGVECGARTKLIVLDWSRPGVTAPRWTGKPVHLFLCF